MPVGIDDLKDAIEDLLNETYLTDKKGKRLGESEKRLEQLNREMQIAAKLERYEEAAHIKKEIDCIKRKTD